ncbi:hypothetical protein [Cupriavidus taiwanensis]|nr:hypothetical protein [Cupriavidus taiwanensis]
MTSFLEELRRQSSDPWGIVALKVGAYVGALLAVVAAAHFVLKYIGA